MDIVSPAMRSRIIGRIRGKDTSPELVVRKTAHAMGYRFRLHRSGLPGTPDLVFPRRNSVVFVHGCFWHRHTGCKYCYGPKTNVQFWQKEFEDNITRDQRVRKELKQMGWRVAVVWECETFDAEHLRRKLKAHLGP